MSRPSGPNCFLEVGTIADRKFKRLEAFDLDVHAYREDESYRCFHVDLDKLQPEKLKGLALRVIASSGTRARRLSRLLLVARACRAGRRRR